MDNDRNIPQQEKSMALNRSHWYLFLLALGFIGWSTHLSAAEFARVERLYGEAWIERGATRERLVQAAVIAHDDLLQTGADSRLQLALSDGGTLNLGENTRLRAKTISETPSHSLAELDLKGAFRMVSGIFRGKHKQEWVINTPVAVIGIRGTDFFAGPIDGALDVMVISGRVEVSNSAGRVLLEPKEGTVVGDASTAPSTPILWGAAKVQRAFSMVNFPDQ